MTGSSHQVPTLANPIGSFPLQSLNGQSPYVLSFKDQNILQLYRLARHRYLGFYVDLGSSYRT